MKLNNEDQLLDKEFRIRLIDHIEGTSNIARKNEALKRHEVYKDNAVKYVMLKLKRELKNEETIALMENRASNISICRKMINKLGRVYSDAVQRTTNDKTTDVQIDELASLLNFNQRQKKVDRYTRLFKNCLPWIYPDLVADGKYRLCMKVMAPDQYDVLESPNDPEEMAAVILSDFVDTQLSLLPLVGAPQVTALEGSANAKTAGLYTKKKNYIVWSKKYHFTFDEKGEIIASLSPEDLLNPIQMIPGVTAAEDQDGCYWAEGGQDIVDGSILVNTLITDMHAIAYMQGWGQIVITGDRVPDSYQMGPHHALILRYDAKKDEAKPEVSVINANPPLADWRASIEQYVALLLSTNNLSPTSVTSKLDVANFASGIAMLIDRSESSDSVEDKQKEFYWIEQKEWAIARAWHNLYYDRNLLVKEFKDVGRLPDNIYVTPKFVQNANEVTTEAQRLENAQKRKDIGLATQLDLIMQDNPGMTKEEAEKKLLEIKKDQLERMVKTPDNTPEVITQ